MGKIANLFDESNLSKKGDKTMKQYPSIKDKVKVTDKHICEIKNPRVLAHVVDKIGTVVGDHYNGWFDVEFDLGNGFTVEYGYNGFDLEVVEKAKCDCGACQDLETRFKNIGLEEQQEQTYVAPDGSC